jgi:hypothetical protein
VRSVIDHITVTLDGKTVPAETTLADVGAHVAVVSTALPGLGLTVTNTYVGADDTDTIVVDLVLAPRPDGRARTETLPRDGLPVTHARERCLLDHVARVRDAISERHTAVPAIDIGDAALEQVASS